MTGTILGLFSSLEDDLLDMAWVPRWLRRRPFLIGFCYLYVPVTTVNAIRASLRQYDAEQSALKRTVTHDSDRVRDGCAAQCTRSPRPACLDWQRQPESAS